MTIYFFSILFFWSNDALGESLRIVSWNLMDFGQSRDDNEILLIAKELRRADIVAIQEVVAKHTGGVKAVARLVSQLNRMGAKWDYRISIPTQSSSAYKSERYAYLWKTSKVSLIDGGPRLISEMSSIVQREPYQIQFKTNSQEILTLINYHACTHNKYYPERAEIIAISQWLLVQPYNNVIWCGDLNLVIDDIAFNTILSSGYTSVLKGQKTSLKMKCIAGEYLSRAEDNILYKFSSLDFSNGSILDFVENGDCREVSWKRTSYSDHLDVAMEVVTD